MLLVAAMRILIIGAPRVRPTNQKNALLHGAALSLEKASELELCSPLPVNMVILKQGAYPKLVSLLNPQNRQHHLELS